MPYFSEKINFPVKPQTRPHINSNKLFKVIKIFSLSIIKPIPSSKNMTPILFFPYKLILTSKGRSDHLCIYKSRNLISDLNSKLVMNSAESTKVEILYRI